MKSLGDVQAIHVGPGGLLTGVADPRGYGTAEGSYGLDGDQMERPEDTATPGCDLPQDLMGTCGSP